MLYFFSGKKQSEYVCMYCSGGKIRKRVIRVGLNVYYEK